MRAAILLIPLTLAACATPRERCIGSVNRDVSVLTQLVAETRGNLARGYAIEETQEVRVRDATCRGRTADGVRIRVACEETDTFTRRNPIAIDLDAERVKLASIEERLRQAQINAQSGVAQCVATHPE